MEQTPNSQRSNPFANQVLASNEGGKRMTILLSILAVALIGSVAWYIYMAMNPVAVTPEVKSTPSTKTQTTRVENTELALDESYREIDAAMKADNESDLKNIDLEF